MSPPHTTFTVLLLGPFAVHRDGVPLQTGSWQRSVQTLLKLLATVPERRRLREEIVEVLWPDASPETGGNNLRYVLNRLRRELGGDDPAPILADRTWIALNGAYTWEIDLERFEDLAGRLERDEAAVDELATLYRGEPLPEDRYEDWAVPLRTHLMQRWQRACRIAAESCERKGQTEETLRWLERALDGDPLDEDALRASLRLLAVLGRRSEALRRYGQFEERLRQELDLEPASETRELVEGLRAGTGPAASTAVRQSPAAPEPHRAAGPPIQVLPEGAYLGALPAAPLVGREGERAALQRAVERALGGRSRLTLLAGEPGVGKTRLAQEVTRLAHESGFLVATGRCYEPERLVPYYPFLEALDTVSAAIPALRDEARGRWPYLARLLPGGERSFDGRSGRDPNEEVALIGAVTAYLHAVAETVPLAILLDDLHWADEASLKLLLHLTRRVQRHPIFLLGTYRDLDVGPVHPLARGFLDLSREDMVEVITVRPLAPHETGSLVAQTLGAAALPDDLAGAVHAATDGNAFFTQQVARSLLEEGRVARMGDELDWRGDGNGRITAPQSVRLVVAGRLVRLAPATQELLGEASVLGQSFAFDDLARMSGRPEGDVEAALEEAEGAGLVRETGIDQYAFSHALAQGAVYDGIPARRRRRLHGEAGRAIEDSPEKERRAAELARHFVEAGDRERALRYSLLAGDGAAAVFGHAEAERHYRSAVRLAREGEDREEEAQALEKLGNVLLQRGAYDEAIERLEAAARLYRDLGMPDDEARTVAGIGDVHWWRGSAREGLRRLHEALLEFDRGTPTSGLARLYVSLAQLQSDLDDNGAALTAGERASELAQAAGDDAAFLRAELVRVWALWSLGRSADTLETLEALIPVAERGSNFLTLGTALLSAAIAALHRGELTRSLEYRERLLDVGIRSANPVAAVAGRSQVGAGLFMLGRWDEAREHLEAALAMAREAPGPGSPDFVLMDLGNLEVGTGNWERGRQLLEEAQAIAEEKEIRDLFRLTQLFLAHLDLQEGEPGRAIERLTPLLDDPGLAEHQVTPLMPVLARAHLRIGDRDRAEQLLLEARRRTEAQQNLLDLAVTLSVQLELHRVRGEWEAAESVFEDVLARARTMGFRVLEGSTLLDGAELALEHGDPEVARRRGDEALAIFRELGARKSVEAAEAVLERIAR